MVRRAHAFGNNGVLTWPPNRFRGASGAPGIPGLASVPPLPASLLRVVSLRTVWGCAPQSSVESAPRSHPWSASQGPAAVLLPSVCGSGAGVCGAAPFTRAGRAGRVRSVRGPAPVRRAEAPPAQPCATDRRRARGLGAREWPGLKV